MLGWDEQDPPQAKKPKNDDTVIDESLYSRQLYVLGEDAMKKMSQSDILVVGFSGLAAEICKNLLLSGVRSVSIYDTQQVTLEDVGTNCFLTPADVGKSRVECSLPRLMELNPTVACLQFPHQTLELKALEEFATVVLVDRGNVHDLEAMASHCHQHGVKVVITETRGPSGYLFIDFGNDFIVVDTDGKDPSKFVITSIDAAEDSGLIIAVDDENGEPLDLMNGDVVRVDDVEGLPGLNGKSFEVKILGTHKLSIKAGDAVNSGEKYLRGGYINQIKQSKAISFKSLTDSLKAPEIMVIDLAQIGREHCLHTAWQALYKFQSSKGCFPRPVNREDAEEVVRIAKEELKAENVDVELTKQLSMTCRYALNPVCTFFGGAVAQEVLKSVSGKFNPINQWMYYDCMDVLPDSMSELNMENYTVETENRYINQIMILGKQLNEKLRNLNYFIVGSGALGCEYIKNFALMGIGSGPRGSITVTDMDDIEVSNLSRQFLFRREHVGQQKSTVAAAAAKHINPQCKIRSMNKKVASETEDTFDDKFWDRLDGVCNALDNVKARLYVDSQCISHRLSLLESGTLGPQANSMVIIPMVTESYGTQRDPPEKSIPMCTMHYYPNTIEHTIHWARDLFDGLFNKYVNDVNDYITNPSKFVTKMESDAGTRLQTLENVHNGLINERPKTVEDCIQWARLQFEEFYVNSMKQLIHTHPLDKTDKEGKLFWSGSKKPPTVTSFDTDNQLHLNFMVFCTLLHAQNYNISCDLASLTTEDGLTKIKNVAQTTKIAPFVPVKLNIPTDNNDESAKPQDNLTAEQLQEQIQREEEWYKKTLAEVHAYLQSNDKNSLLMREIEFDKDNDKLGHIDFVTSASNLRATNYSIPIADKMHTKRISGRIIPAMITTTALITGLVCVELYKLAQNKQLEQHRNGYVNLGLPTVLLTEPRPAPKLYYIPPPDRNTTTTTTTSNPETQPPDYKGRSFTLWERLDITSTGKDITLHQFLSAFKKKFSLEIVLMDYNGIMIYNSMFGSSSTLECPLHELVCKKAGIDGSKHKYMDFGVSCDTLSGETTEAVPPVRYKILPAKPKPKGK